MRASKLKELEKWLLEKRKGLVSGVRSRNATRFETEGGTLDLADQAASAYTKEFLLSLGDAERRLLRQVDAAWRRSASGRTARARSAGKRSPSSAWKPFPLLSSALRARRRRNAGKALFSGHLPPSV